MTRDETKKIIRIMMDSYPNYKPMDLSETVDVWCMMLEDFSYQQIAMALKAYILTDTSGFAPSIGQLVEKIKGGTSQLNEMEAWALVSKAIRNGYYGAEEEFSKLPEVVQKAVGNPSNLRHWSQTNIESIENVVQSNFLRSYRIESKRAIDVSKFPALMNNDYRNLIEDNTRE